MDRITIEQYDRHAVDFVRQYEAAPPRQLYELIRLHFHKEGTTADIGCGSGRDTAWLQGQGARVTGWDASTMMVHEARARYGEIADFSEAVLPALEPLADGICDNVLCAGVLMHLPAEEVIFSCQNLLRITREGGVLLVSWRLGRAVDPQNREADGRLYTPLDSDRIGLLFESLGGVILYRGLLPDGERSGVAWQVLVVRKTGGTCRSGLFRIQDILVNDSKNSTYKYALIKALCHMACNEAEACVWENGYVWVPLMRVALYWVRAYWPFFTEQRQDRGLRQRPAGKEMAIAVPLQQMATRTPDLFHDLDALHEWIIKNEMQEQLKIIALTILKMPVRYAGGGNYEIFSKEQPAALSVRKQRYFGVPVGIWHDLVLFNHWIDESISVRWAEEVVRFSKKEAPLDKSEVFSRAISLLRMQGADKRSTNEIRDFVTASGAAPLLWGDGSEYAVDHLIPFSVIGNNDLWNLIPADRKGNGKKSDLIPSTAALRSSGDILFRWWSRYFTRWQERFAGQLARFHGVRAGEENWEEKTLRSLELRCDQIAQQRGIRRWDGV